MDLFDTISADIKKAMLAKDRVRLEALRGIKKEFLEAKTAKGSDGTLTDEAAIRVLVKMAKQRRESAAIYIEQQRPDLAESELAEVAVIEEYLPKQLSPEELDSRLKEIIARVGATSPAMMGKVMGVATKELAGLADGRAISTAVKDLLQQNSL
ncbi:MAG: GatB/YqeY domain-containing protein [Clostridiales bacterium]|nr:GatB/YqeY domain-containing protein [Clostridiales bacterium]